MLVLSGCVVLGYWHEANTETFINLQLVVRYLDRGVASTSVLGNLPFEVEVVRAVLYHFNQLTGTW